jgi:cytoskeletal protein RodZ
MPDAPDAPDVSDAPDALDEQLRRGLAAAAASISPPAVPGPEGADGLLARLRQRRHRHHLAGAGALVVAAALVVLGVVIGTGRQGSPAQRIHTLGPAGGAAATSPVSRPAGSTGTTTDNSATVPTTSSCPGTSCGTRPPATTGPGTTTPHAVPTTPGVTSRTAITTTRPTTTTTAPPAGGTIVVTEAASGSTVTLHIGQSLRVQLSGSALDPWSQPTASDPNILQPQPTGMMPTQGSAIAQYRGVAAGQATVTATQDPTCRSATPPCAILTRMFSITVNVVG